MVSVPPPLPTVVLSKVHVKPHLPGEPPRPRSSRPNRSDGRDLALGGMTALRILVFGGGAALRKRPGVGSVPRKAAEQGDRSRLNLGAKDAQGRQPGRLARHIWYQ